MAVMLAFVAGIRQQTAPVLIPLWGYTFWKFPAQRRQRLWVGLLLAGLLCAAWLIPMLALSGGLGAYVQLYSARMRLNATYASWGGTGLESLARNAAFIVANCWIGLSVAALLAVVEFALWLMSAESRRDTLERRGEQLQFIAIWLVPMVAFGLVVFTAMSGHILNYFPSIVILTGLALSRLIRGMTQILAGLRTRITDPHRFVLVSVTAGVTLMNAAVFLLPPQQTTWLREGLSLTATHIRQHDQQMARWFHEIRSTYRPDEVMICHDGEFCSGAFVSFSITCQNTKTAC